MNKPDLCMDTIRTSEAEQQVLLAKLKETRNAYAVERRRWPRYTYSVREGLVLEIEGCSVKFRVRPNDISRGGVSFLNGHFLYAGQRCGIALRTIDGEQVLAQGQVVNCRCVSGRIHLVGMAFDELIDVELFVRTPDTAGNSDTDKDSSPGDYPYVRVTELAHELRRLAANKAPQDQLRNVLGELLDTIPAEMLTSDETTTS